MTFLRLRTHIPKRQERARKPAPTAEARARAAGFGLGVDIGGTSARAAVVELSTGELICRATLRHDEYQGRFEPYSPEAVADTAAALVRQVVDDAGKALCRELPRLEVEDFGHVGMAVAGARTVVPTKVAGGDVEYVPHVQAQNIGSGWKAPVPLGVQVSEALGGAPCVLVNDVLGAAAHVLEGDRTAVHVSVGTGLGGAKKLRGHFEEVDLWSLPAVDPNGGGLHPLEEFIGGKAIAQKVRADLDAGVETSIRDQVREGDAPHSGHVEAAYQAGDPYARSLWQTAGATVSAQLVQLTHLIPDPTEAVVLGGGVLLKCPGLVEELALGYAAASRAPVPDNFFRLAPGGEDAGLIGAAKLTPASGN